LEQQRTAWLSMAQHQNWPFQFFTPTAKKLWVFPELMSLYHDHETHFLKLAGIGWL